MNKLFVLILALAVVVAGGVYVNSQSLESVVIDDVVTTAVDGNSGSVTALAISSNSTGGIHTITISKSGVGHAQTITFWDGFTNDTSTAAVNKIWQVIMTSGTTSVAIHQENFGDRWMLNYNKGLAVRKSLAGTKVAVSLQHD